MQNCKASLSLPPCQILLKISQNSLSYDDFHFWSRDHVKTMTSQMDIWVMTIFFFSFETIPTKSWSHFREIESFASFSAKFYNFKTSTTQKSPPGSFRFLTLHRLGFLEAVQVGGGPVRPPPFPISSFFALLAPNWFWYQFNLSFIGPK